MSAELDFVSSSWLRSFRAKLKKWYAANARDLPWRRTRNPYHIWISEIMLQQTTVAAVIPYFERFLERFPTVEDLAEAEESEVLRLWEGLGYYSRARNIHKAARFVVEELQGQFPTDVNELQQLPGIGRYTAGAIASFAFDQRAPIVEANTLRLYCRLMAFDGDPRSTEGQALLWELAEKVLPQKEPGAFNQASMELGGTLCSIKEPKCDQCPVNQNCVAFHNGDQHRIPAPKQRQAITEVTEVYVAIQKGHKFLLRQCQESERWAGMWDFPRFEISDAETNEIRQIVRNAGQKKDSNRRLFPPESVPAKFALKIESDVREATGIDCRIREVEMTLKHSVTRYRISLICLRADFQSGRIHVSRGTAKWVSHKELANLPLSVTGRKFANVL